VNALLSALQDRALQSPSDIVLEGNGLAVSALDLLSDIESLMEVLTRTAARTIALYADNSPSWAVVDLACQFAGICMIPIPTFFSAAQVDHLLSSAGVELLIFQESLADSLDFRHRANLWPMPALEGYHAAILSPVRAALKPLHTSKITFTSGSTGQPKGVCLSFDQCLNVAGSLAQAIDVSQPRHLCLLPLSTLLENIGGIYMPLISKGSSVLVAPEELGMLGSSRLDPQRLLDAIERYQPNTMILVPQLLSVLETAMQAGWRPPQCLDFVAVGGARVAAEMVERVRAKGLPVYEGYGLSESASVVSLNTAANNRPGTSGKVLPHVSIASRQGELEVSGNAFLGYMNQPGSWGLQTIKTGDVGSIDSDGYVTVSGRSKNILISSYGRNISPEWVESELMASGVFHQVLVLGDGRPYCVALVLAANTEIKDDDISLTVASANKSLPDYARVEGWLRLEKPLSSAEGLLTENGRPRRDNIAEHFSPRIDQLYYEQAEIVSP